MINAAVAGLGWWGRHMIETLQGSDRIRVVAATAGRPERHRDFAEAAGIDLAANFERLLADPRIEAVILATPNTQHESQVRLATEAGKQVFCEKPLALTRGAAERMVADAAKAGIVLGVGHERRFEPTMEEVARLVGSEAFGTAMHIEANWSHDILAALDADNWRGSVEEAPAGAMTGMGVHMTDLFGSLLGPIEAVAAQSAWRVLDFPTGDVIAVLFRFASGATGQFTAVTKTPYYCRMTVFGEAMWVEARDTKHPQHGGETHLITCVAGGEPETRVLAGANSVKANLHEWADAIEGRASYRFTDEQRVGNVAVLEAVARAANSGRWETV
jgi:predicted dehydrogenase